MDPQETGNEAQTNTTITERGRGSAERAVLGSQPYGSMLRIILAVTLFIVIFGSIFFFANRG